MKIDRALIGALLIGILVLSPSAYAITISVGGDAGGFTENINAGDKDAVYSSTMIAANSFSHSIEGSGNLKESHRVSNTAGANAEVGVDIRRAEWYSYSYDLWPGRGSSWPASKFAQVAASEQLDVYNAKYIQAYANAFNAKGYSAGVSIVVSDPGKEASLTGYRNLAMASKNEAFASQTAESAFSLDGFIQADSGADFTRLLSKPLKFREDTADASLRVDRGSVEGYSDLASASANGVTASQLMDAATGDQIQTSSESASWTASLFQGLKKTDAKVSTRAEGTLTGYNASAESSKDYARADQEGHIVGTFTSKATAGSVSNTRSSNYGTEYDFNMQAKKDASGSYATGNLGYYVDNVSPVANRIQGAVDASESGDAINVAPGTYFENVHIDKSLSVKGVGASDTIVDGQQAGSVFTIGKNDPDVDVSLSGMTIQGGSGTYTERWPGEPLVQCGGGIWNAGRLSLADSIVSGNTANEYGSGIWSTGTLTVDRSLIYGNGMPRDGGGIWSSGELTVRDSTVAGNSAYWNGGGIWNSGNMLMERSNVTGNIAHYYGGGIANDMGQATVVDSTISGNTADLGGGGVYNIFGQVSLDNNAISRNTGNVGGGIMNNGGMIVRGGFVSNNNATNGGGIFNMGTMELNRTLVDKNAATENGGGIYNSGIATIKGSTISENTAGNVGGGIFNNGTVKVEDSNISENIAQYGGGVGGGIFNQGAATIAGSKISGNTAEYEGGGIFNNFAATLNIDSSTISENTATESFGGGISSYGTATITGSTISGNTANYGGGVYSDGSLRITDNMISGNIASRGAGVYNNWQGNMFLNGGSISDNNAVEGGGIYNYYGTLNLEGGSISANKANAGGGIVSYGTVNLDGTTIDLNTANINSQGYGYGGGIYNAGGVVNLNSGSVEQNTAAYGGGIWNVGTLYGNLSIVHDNTPDQIAPVYWLPEV